MLTVPFSVLHISIYLITKSRWFGLGGGVGGGEQRGMYTGGGLQIRILFFSLLYGHLRGYLQRTPYLQVPYLHLTSSYYKYLLFRICLLIFNG